MKRLAAAAMAVLCIIPFFSGCSANKGEQVVIYSSMEDYRNEAPARTTEGKISGF